MFMVKTIDLNSNFYYPFTFTYLHDLRIMKRSMDMFYIQNLTIL